MTQSPLELDFRRVWTGDEANEKVRRLAESRASKNFGPGEAVTFGFPFFDQNIPPMMPSQLTLLLGLTSHGKSLAASTICRHTLNRIKNSGNAALLVVMTEESVEARRIQTWGDSRVTLRSVLLGDTPLEIIDENISKSTKEPIYFIGQTTDLEDVGTEEGVIRPSTIANGVNQLIRMGVNPELIVIDHVHDLEPNRKFRGEAEMHDAVGIELKQFCNALHGICPVLALAQCRKEVESRPPLLAIPNAYDLKSMQGLAARAANILSIFYPQRHNAAGIKFPTVRGSVLPSKGLFLIHCAKARDGKCAGDTVPMSALDDEGNWSNQLREIEHLIP